MEKAAADLYKRATFRGRRRSMDVVRIKEEEKAFNANIGIPARGSGLRKRSVPAGLGAARNAPLGTRSLALSDTSDPEMREATRAFGMGPKRGKRVRKRRVSCRLQRSVLDFGREYLCQTWKIGRARLRLFHNLRVQNPRPRRTPPIVLLRSLEVLRMRPQQLGVQK